MNFVPFMLSWNNKLEMYIQSIVELTFSRISISSCPKTIHQEWKSSNSPSQVCCLITITLGIACQLRGSFTVFHEILELPKMQASLVLGQGLSLAWSQLRWGHPLTAKVCFDIYMVEWTSETASTTMFSRTVIGRFFKDYKSVAWCRGRVALTDKVLIQHRWSFTRSSVHQRVIAWKIVCWDDLAGLLWPMVYYYQPNPKALVTEKVYRSELHDIHV